MLFKLAWTHSREARDKTIKQFMETGGMPPENVELISRYHNLDGTGGFAVMESIDAAALADYALDWNGLINIEITAIMDDETIGRVFGKKFAQLKHTLHTSSKFRPASVLVFFVEGFGL